MFSLFSVGESKSATYWEGWQAVELHRQCAYTDPQERKVWAKGFADGVAELRDSKVWYKSRTLVVGLVMLVIGIGLVVYGLWVGGSQAVVGFGSGLSTSSILMSALRLITNTSISSSGGQFTPPPLM